MKTIKQILMERDGMTEAGADEMIQEARSQWREYLIDGDSEAAYEICQEYFGLEPDYLVDLV
jgi:hypothetical protein